MPSNHKQNIGDICPRVRMALAKPCAIRKLANKGEIK